MESVKAAVAQGGLGSRNLTAAHAVSSNVEQIVTRNSIFVIVCVLALVSSVRVQAQDASPQPAKSSVGAKKILIFGDMGSKNPPPQQALMERSIRQVADAFKTHGYDVDLIPTANLNSRVVGERLAHYASTLTTNDTFVLYSHSHGGPQGTFFARWSEFADGILALPARDVVIFAMSCHSGKLTDTLTRLKPKWEGRSKSGRSLVVLTPVNAGQNAGPSPERRVGNPFAYAVTTAAQGAADGISGNDKDGQVGMEELVEYVLKTTREKSRGKSHAPQFAGEYPAGARFLVVYTAIQFQGCVNCGPAVEG
jgi:hypothetical protein